MVVTILFIYFIFLRHTAIKTNSNITPTTIPSATPGEIEPFLTPLDRLRKRLRAGFPIARTIHNNFRNITKSVD